MPTLLDEEEVGIVKWARKMLAQNKHIQMVNASISREDGLIEAHVKEYFEIAGMCTSEIRRERPPMAKKATYGSGFSVPKSNSYVNLHSIF